MSRTNGQKIPKRHPNIGLRGNLSTSATKEGVPHRVPGATTLGVEDFEYEDLPPPTTRREESSSYWTIERIGSYLGIGAVVVSVIIFFFRMDSNIDGIKTDIKEEKNRIEKLTEETNKQTSSIQRIEDEIRRIEDNIRDRKK